MRKRGNAAAHMGFLNIIRRMALREKLSIHEIARRTGMSRKQQRRLKQLHADLVALGFDGPYSRAAAVSRSWQANRKREQQTTGRGTFVPLVVRSGGSIPVRLE